MVLSEDLKKVSVFDLQVAVAEAVAAKIGAEVRCTITAIDFDHLGCVNARISLIEPTYFDDPSPPGDPGPQS